MAQITQRRPENAPGDLYVDFTCIDCDTCRWMAPSIFNRQGDQSAVHHQPQTDIERRHALQALLACPTASIGTVTPPSDIKAVQQQFPLPIADGVYHCGYHSEKSYGAASYFIQRPDGNVLVDSPRFTAPLAQQLEAMGGIRYLYLTHRDDVADHQKFRDRFGCDRLLHEDDITASTRSIERPLTGHDPIAIASGLTVIPVPGHTQGHTVLLYNNTFLFTGDHLAWSPRLQQLYAFRRHCWYSWPQLKQSMHRLANYSFEWVLPGHGRRYHSDRATMAAAMQQCLAWLETA